MDVFFGVKETDKLCHGTLLSMEGIRQFPPVPPPTLEQCAFGFKESDTGVVCHLSGYLKKCTELVPGDPTSQRQKITAHVYPPRKVQDVFLKMCGVMMQLKGMGYKQFPGFDEYKAMQLGSPNQEC